MEDTTQVVLVLEYDGTRYQGSQYQENGPTIQGEIELAIERLTGKKTRITAASRTDAGVHAKGQVVGFRTDAKHPASTWISALNHYLEKDIAVKAAYEAPCDFNVRRHAWSREYRYNILNSPVPSPLLRNYAYHVPQPLDAEAMDEACRPLVGEHDFSAFSPVKGIQGRRRVYEARVYRDGDLVKMDMAASSFLPHQVRHTVGGLIRVGLGKTGVAEFGELGLSGRPGAVGPAAPAKGLFLMKVNYRDFPPAS